MSVDPWFRDLANVNRQRQAEEKSRLDARWDLLSHGDLSPEEEAELKALAEASPEAAEALEAFRPLGPDFHAGVVKTLREQGLVPEAPPPVPKPLPFHKRALRRWAGPGSLAALAAVLLVMVLRPPAEISPYSASLGGGDKTSRGESGETAGGPRVFSPGSTLTLVAAPRDAFTAPSEIEVRAFAARGPELIRLSMTEERAENGNVKLRGSIGEEIRLSPGTWKVWVVVCRPGKLPDLQEARDQLQSKALLQKALCQVAESETFEVKDQI